MNKSDLIAVLVVRSMLARRQADAVVNLVFDTMSAALNRNERIEIRGFGSFVARHYQARGGRDPRTGKCIAVPAKRVPFFKCGKELRQRVARGDFVQHRAEPAGTP